MHALPQSRARTLRCTDALSPTGERSSWARISELRYSAARRTAEVAAGPVREVHPPIRAVDRPHTNPCGVMLYGWVH